MTDEIRWDLAPILPSLGEEDVTAAFEALEALVSGLEALAPRLDALDEAGVAEAIDRLGAVEEQAKRLVYRGMLAFSADTTDDAARTFMERARARATGAANRTRFFTHWIKRLDDAKAAAVAPTDPDRAHFFEETRRGRPYMLEEPVERVIADKDRTGAGALRQAREILDSGLRFEDPRTGEAVSRAEIARYVHDPDPDLRRRAYDTMLGEYAAHASMFSHLYRNLVLDWNTEHLDYRGYPTSESPRHQANEVEEDVVATMLEVLRERRAVWQRYFTWKSGRLGLAPSRYDIYAPVESAAIEIDFDAARRTVMAVFEGFHPRFAELAARVFDEAHVDALPREHKRGGAFCATVQSRMTPYVMLNHTGDARSVSTMAHELGHAIHAMLAADRHPLVSHATLPLAETASIFCELLLHHHLLAEHPEGRDGITSERLGDLYATIGRQAYFARFEQAAHRLIREGRPTGELDAAYAELLEEQFGDMELPEHFAREWLAIPHFANSPFYVSSYSFGALLSLSLYGRYEAESGMTESILEILAAGGSRRPAVLLAEHGIDIADPAFWHGGMDVVERMLGDLGGPSA